MFLSCIVTTAAVLLPLMVSILRDDDAATVSIIGTEVPYYALLCALGFGVTETMRSVSINACWYFSSWLGVTLCAAVRDLTYAKMLRLRMGQADVGSVLNMITADASRVEMAAQFSSFIIFTPIMLVIVSVVLYFVFGTAARQICASI